MMKSILALAALVAGAVAQRLSIASPTNGTTVPVGSPFLVRLHQDNAQGVLQQVSVTIALTPCYGPCGAPSTWPTGTVLYNGAFNPQYNSSLPAQVGLHEDFTFTLPEGWPRARTSWVLRTSRTLVVHAEFQREDAAEVTHPLKERERSPENSGWQSHGTGWDEVNGCIVSPVRASLLNISHGLLNGQLRLACSQFLTSLARLSSTDPRHVANMLSAQFSLRLSSVFVDTGNLLIFLVPRWQPLYVADITFSPRTGSSERVKPSPHGQDCQLQKREAYLSELESKETGGRPGADCLTFHGKKQCNDTVRYRRLLLPDEAEPIAVTRLSALSPLEAFHQLEPIADFSSENQPHITKSVPTSAALDILGSTQGHHKPSPYLMGSFQPWAHAGPTNGRGFLCEWDLCAAFPASRNPLLRSGRSVFSGRCTELRCEIHVVPMRRGPYLGGLAQIGPGISSSAISGVPLFQDTQNAQPACCHKMNPTIDAQFAETFCRLTKELHEVSEQLSGIIREEDDHHGGPEHCSGDDEPGANPQRKRRGETVVGTLREREKDITDRWKDELNNLLVFAGLFSAVVTAFTAISFGWLQQDSGDATNMLLAHISLQLANPSNPALPLQNVTSSFSPSPIAVPVNVLWILSLTLSLMSAFLAIAVQQWLRQLRLPADLPVRRAVQLLSLRYEGLQAWQVPGIISVLPLLLQIAVVLFLAGLLLFLRSLDPTITLAFAAVAAVGLLTFLVTTLVPLIDIRCPYKSPLVPTILIVLQWLTYPFALAVAGIGFPIVSAFHLYRKHSFLSRYGIYNRHHFDTSGLYQRLLEYVKSFGTHMYVNIGQFWILREYRHIFTLEEEETSGLESSSLVDVLLSIHSSSFSRVMQCLNDFNPQSWEKIFIRAVSRSLYGVVPSIAWDDVFSSILDPQMALYVRKWLSRRHHILGSRALHSRMSAEDGEVDWNEGSAALTVFHELDKGSGAVSERHAGRLLDACTNQRLSMASPLSDGDLIPACLVFDAIQNGHMFNEHDTLQLIDFASSCFILDQYYDWHPRTSGVIYIVLVSSTSALAAAITHPSLAAAAGRQLIVHLADFLGHSMIIDLLASMLREHCEDPWKRPDYMALPLLLQVLCKTLSVLAQKDVILQDATCSSVYIAGILRALCKSQQHEDLHEALEHLKEFEQIECAKCGEPSTPQTTISLLEMPTLVILPSYISAHHEAAMVAMPDPMFSPHLGHPFDQTYRAQTQYQMTSLNNTSACITDPFDPRRHGDAVAKPPSACIRVSQRSDSETSSCAASTVASSDTMVSPSIPWKSLHSDKESYVEESGPLHTPKIVCTDSDSDTIAGIFLASPRSLVDTQD
ncbi:hypothetical protein NM688_g4290 [Phlebia brevispora]|uniref:Uncharacterized protein n=1 Tax=Phlebia brevispora TaxID=194682 RepID=A0ACC1T3B8_9APHY|nr:hypothetical protein NM688_g4290 [Phlebia brevispora]